jgi:hypothetical protein
MLAAWYDNGRPVLVLVPRPLVYASQRDLFYRLAAGWSRVYPSQLTLIHVVSQQTNLFSQMPASCIGAEGYIGVENA